MKPMRELSLPVYYTNLRITIQKAVGEDNRRKVKTTMNNSVWNIIRFRYRIVDHIKIVANEINL